MGFSTHCHLNALRQEYEHAHNAQVICFGTVKRLMQALAVTCCQFKPRLLVTTGYQGHN